MVVVSSNFIPPAEGILYQRPSIKLLVHDQEVGTGALYITENNVVWGGGSSVSGGPSPNLYLTYETISLHAIQKDPSPALYIMLNYDLKLPGIIAPPPSNGLNDIFPDFNFGDLGLDEHEHEHEHDHDHDDEAVTQLKFIPENNADLQAMYSALCQGQTLHPDPDDDVNDEFMDVLEGDGDDDFEDAVGSFGQHGFRVKLIHIHSTNGDQIFQAYEEIDDLDEE